MPDSPSNEAADAFESLHLIADAFRTISTGTARSIPGMPHAQLQKAIATKIATWIQ